MFPNQGPPLESGYALGTQLDDYLDEHEHTEADGYTLNLPRGFR